MRRISEDGGTRFSGGTSRARQLGGTERGAVLVLFALLLPLVLAVGAIVVTIGSWYVHGKHLQTKVDAAAFAGGGSWGFPCGPDIDAGIEGEARKYVGVHTKADNSTYSTTTFNPQVGGVGEDQIMVALNQAQWWDGGFSAPDWTSPLGSVCESKVLDVRATENDSPLLWGWLPFWPDIKKKARVEIQEVDGLTGLLPIAVRIPQPLSAAAVFYDEADGSILDVELFRQVCSQSVTDCLFGVPPGLGQWTTEPDPANPGGSWANFNVAVTTGVVVATSFRPACGAGTPPAGPPCLDDSGWIGQPVDTFCRQANGAVRCYDADGLGTSQTVRSGVHFIRGYGNADTGTGAPQLRTAYLDSQSLGCASYFNSSPNPCTARLNVAVDLGALEGMYPNPPGPDTQQPLRASDVQVRYRLVRANGTGYCDYGANCDVQGSGSGTPTFSTQGNTVSPHLPITVSSRGNAVAIEVMLRNAVNHTNPDCTGLGFNPNCRWFYTASSIDPDTPPTDEDILAAPIHRSFMGDIDLTTPLKWLRLTVDQDCNLTTMTDRIVGGDPDAGVDAASQPAGAERCYIVEMGTSGGLARDQDEPPIAFNLGDNSSQRAYVDCDPAAGSNLKSEIATGCQTPSYSANKFDTTPICPGSAGFFNTPKPAPFDNWPPFRCVLTQTGNSNQVEQGLNERLFGKSNNPNCPADVAGEYVKGRNYWHRMNNSYTAETFAWDGTGPPGPDGARKGNTLRSDDPRLFTLFFTSYDSFTETGNEVYPIVGFGNFYLTGYGRTQNGSWQGGAPQDPCDDGNDGDLSNGTGNEPPPDLDYSKNTTWAWGHFVKDVTPPPFSTGGSGVLCNPEASFQPCVPVLVE